MKDPLALRVHLDLIRSGDWREVVLESWLYELRRWRCHLLGHAFGDDSLEYEDAGYPVHVGTWRECKRPGCGAAEELWSIYGEARGVLG